jgi:5-methyltetrahydrofolate--homocysteine methyltransferase
MAVEDIFKAVLGFDAAKTEEMTKSEIASGTGTQKILNEGLIAAMDEVGTRFSKGLLFVPEMLAAARAMKAGLAILKPVLAKAESNTIGTVVIGTVKGDLHDIGKNLVAMMIEGAGFTVIDLGVDVDATGFLSAAKENSADIVALSALLTTTLPAMEATVRAFSEEGVEVKTMVGGAPVTQSFADKIGAGGYAGDAARAVDLARSLLREKANGKT